MTAGATIEALGSLRLAASKPQTVGEQTLEIVVEHIEASGVPCSPLDDKNASCDICYTEDNKSKRRECCGVIVCTMCFGEYLERKVALCVARIECPNCDKSISEGSVLEILEESGRIQTRDEFARQVRGDKRCPRCSSILGKYVGGKCPHCSLIWCFRCDANHEGVSCDLYNSSHHTQLKSWAKSVSEGQWNAQKCPRCKIYIQRASGCDHMNCAHCRTHFCYRCGGQLRHMKFFGDHYSKLSVFGCKYRYKPNKPFQRKLIRSAVFVGRLIAIPLAGIGALCGLTVVAVLAVPMYAGYHLHKRFNSGVGRKSTATQSEILERKVKAERPSPSS